MPLADFRPPSQLEAPSRDGSASPPPPLEEPTPRGDQRDRPAPRPRRAFESTELWPEDSTTVSASDDVPAVSNAEVGRTLGPYKLQRVLGRGGMGSVWLAEDTRLGRSVAIKLLTAGVGHEASMRERFLREARAAAALDHPNICAIYDLGEVNESELFLVMPFYRGETLRARLEREPLSFDEARRITVQVARALDHAHRAMILHRDIKPANIVLTAESEVKVLDFGLAKILGEIALTHTGRALGTPAYMSPEQATGSAVDQRSDLWSLGATLYEMLAGERAFPGAHPQVVIFSIVTREPTPITSVRHGVPHDLLRVIERTLAKDAAERYASATELLADLEDDSTLPSSRAIALPGPGASRSYPAQPGGAGSAGSQGVGRYTESAPRSRYSTAQLSAGMSTMPVEPPLPARKPWGAIVATVVALGLLAGALYYRSLAQARHQQATRMVDFVLDDLAPELEVNGQVDLLQEAVAEASHYLEEGDAAGGGWPEQRRRARILLQAARLEMTSGATDQALERITEACDLLATPAGSEPAARRELAFCRNNRGEALSRIGEVDTALAESQMVLDLLGSGIEQDNQDTEGRLAAAEAHSRTGRMLIKRGSFEDALHALRRAVRLADSTRGPAPAQSRLMEVTALSHVQVGNIHALQGALVDAEQAYRLALEKSTQARQNFPNQPRWREKVANNENLLANLALRRGNEGQAKEGYQRALTEWEVLRQIDPSNTRWQLEIAKAYFNMSLPYAARPTDQTLSWLQLSRQVLENLLTTDPQNSDAQNILANSLSAIGVTLLQVGRPFEALAPLRQAYDLAVKAHQADPRNYLWAAAEAEMGVYLGECHRLLKDEAQAREFWEGSLALIDANPEVKASPLSAIPAAWALLSLGRVEEAQPYVAIIQDRALLKYARLDELIRRNPPANPDK